MEHKIQVSGKITGFWAYDENYTISVKGKDIVITPEELKELAAYRERLFSAIELALSVDSHHKSYEGEIKLRLPNYFDDNFPDINSYELEVHVYVLGPNRHYIYGGDSLEDCLAQANADLDKWLRDFEHVEEG